ncbi:MAG: hypothetical protein A2X55_08845 [Nitrospirae bacterium GWB2_47_37]|nr:MAG: hypothetical protein A2X55_08845 [Nitrospirae bacterium GWB2_47_37]HAK87618.1 hypothetical protein [Nitrospiraceae bacterium]
MNHKDLKDILIVNIIATKADMSAKGTCILPLMAFMTLFYGAIGLILPAIGFADAVKPIYDLAKNEWEASVSLLIAAGALIGGIIGLMTTKSWVGLVVGILVGVLGGGAFNMSGCAVTTGKALTFQ